MSTSKNFSMDVIPKGKLMYQYGNFLPPLPLFFCWYFSIGKSTIYIGQLASWDGHVPSVRVLSATIQTHGYVCFLKLDDSTRVKNFMPVLVTCLNCKTDFTIVFLSSIRSEFIYTTSNSYLGRGALIEFHVGFGNLFKLQNGLYHCVPAVDKIKIHI